MKKKENLGKAAKGGKGVVMPHLSSVDKMKTKAIETIFIGVIAQNMGYANQSNVVQSGKEVFKKIGSLTYKEFRNIKVLLNYGK